MTTVNSIREALDDTLFDYIAQREMKADAVRADLALAEIHRRHAKPLLARCLKMCDGMPDGEMLAEEMMAITFIRVNEKAGQYRVAGNTDAASGRRRTHAWLSQIARNLLRDWMRNPHRPGLLNPVGSDVDTRLYSAEDFAAMYTDGETPLNGQERRHIADAFKTLDGRTQEVLLETCIQRGRSPKKTHMLRGTTQVLADRLDTSTDNIRRIRRNGIRAINDYLEK